LPASTHRHKAVNPQIKRQRAAPHSNLDSRNMDCEVMRP